MKNKIQERLIHGEKFGRIYRDIISRKCEECGEEKIIIREYEVKTDEKVMAEFKARRSPEDKTDAGGKGEGEGA